MLKITKIGQSAAKHPNGMNVQRLSLGRGVHLNHNLFYYKIVCDLFGNVQEFLYICVE